MIVSFFGHRGFLKGEEYQGLFLKCLEEKVGDEYAEFYLGGYGNFDDFAYACCLKYKKLHPKTKLVFITPYITADYQENHLKNKKERYDEIVYPGLENIPLRFAITYRNRWMVEKADCIIVYILENK